MSVQPYRLLIAYRRIRHARDRHGGGHIRLKLAEQIRAAMVYICKHEEDDCRYQDIRKHADKLCHPFRPISGADILSGLAHMHLPPFLSISH